MKSYAIAALAVGLVGWVRAQDSSSGSVMSDALSSTMLATTAGVSSSAAAPSESADPSASGGQGSSNLAATALVIGNDGISGRFTFEFVPGQGTQVRGQVQGLPINATGPSTFPYHIHTNALNSSHSCASALGHLDPLFVTDGITCDPTQPTLCQEGDLSGKHGRLNTTDGSASVEYLGSFLRWYPAEFSLLGRSLVIHSPNGTRLACGNLISTFDGTADAAGEATNKTSSFQTAYPSAGPPPVRTTVKPFVSGSTDSAILAMVTSPFPLPPVSAGDVSLTTVTIPTTTINGTTYTNLVRPSAVLISGSTFTPGPSATALPTQPPVSYVTSQAPTGGNNGGSSSSVMTQPGSGAGALTKTLPGALGLMLTAAFGLFIGAAVLL